MADHSNQEANRQSDAMQKYYAWQSQIYDATRWTFLFGRNQVIKALPLKSTDRFHLLEIGCGTGYNLNRLARAFPKAQLTGLDASSHMAGIARKQTAAFGDRVMVENRPYIFGESQYNDQMDALLFSYSLTMINPHYRDLILQAKRDLKPGGMVAIADFYDSRYPCFKRHMGNHHVRMDGHLTPLLQAEFETELMKIIPAYGGVWHYFIYIGRKIK